MALAGPARAPRGRAHRLVPAAAPAGRGGAVVRGVPLAPAARAGGRQRHQPLTGSPTPELERRARTTRSRTARSGNRSGPLAAVEDYLPFPLPPPFWLSPPEGVPV